MKHFRKKTQDLWTSWASNEKNWFSIGITGRQIYFGALFASLIKILALQSYIPHCDELKDIASSERFLLTLRLYIWMFPMTSMVIEVVEGCTRRKRADRQHIAVMGSKVHLISEQDFSNYARIFIGIRMIVAVIFSSGAFLLFHLNRLAHHDLLIVLIINSIEVLGRIVEHFSLAKVHQLKEKLLNDNDQTKLFERIEEIIKQERDKLDGLDNKPYVKQCAESKLDCIVLAKLVKKIKDPKRMEEYQKRSLALFSEIDQAAENRTVSPRSNIGLNWYRIGVISGIFTVISLYSLYIEPCIVIMYTEFPDYPYTSYIWITTHFVLNFIFFRTNCTEHGYPGTFYDRVLHYRLFVAFGPNASREAISNLKKISIFTLLFSICAGIFYHYSLLIGTEFKLFISFNIAFLTFCVMAFFCFSKFVNTVVEAEKNNLAIGNESQAEEGDHRRSETV